MRGTNIGASRMDSHSRCLSLWWSSAQDATRFYDEGTRFAGQVAEFASEFRNSPERAAVFDYIPKYGSNQRVHVEIGRARWCPQPPCGNQGAATVVVEHGKSGTGYRIARAASVPEPLRVDKRGGPIRVHMRKAGGVVEVVALD